MIGSWILLKCLQGKLCVCMYIQYIISLQFSGDWVNWSVKCKQPAGSTLRSDWLRQELHYVTSYFRNQRKLRCSYSCRFYMYEPLNYSHMYFNDLFFYLLPPDWQKHKAVLVLHLFLVFLHLSESVLCLFLLVLPLSVSLVVLVLFRIWIFSIYIWSFNRCFIYEF